MRREITRRTAVAGTPALLLPASAEPASQSGEILDDASRLNATRVARSTEIGGGAEAIERLRREIRSARQDGRPVALGGARHSMGGQSLARSGVALSLARSRPEIDTRALTYRVGAGARWRDRDLGTVRLFTEGHAVEQ